MRSLPVLALLLLLGNAGCQDLHEYQAIFAGTPLPDPDLAIGFAPNQTASLEILAADELTLHARLDLPPLFVAADLTSIKHASGDVLGAVKIGSQALRSYLAFVQPTTGAPALVVVSLREDARVDLRVIRGTDELYGVFALARR